ncbi:MAG TPA: efflux RND transporter permease subunit [Candidatus Parcubacteria bacterium]|nr:efflux RND transporter permease subunit [Candidatus Parcubacteria bacterium]
MKLADFSVERPVTVLMIALIIVVLGGLFFARLGLDLLPEIEYPVVSVVTTYPGVTSEDIEEVLTKPIEDAVSTVQDVKSIKSFSQEGLSAVMIEFNWGTNIDSAAQDVKDKLDLIQDFLPADADRPLVVKLDVGTMPVLGYGVTLENLDTLELRRLLEDNIKDKLERIDGVASVQIMGGRQREILVSLDKSLLESYGLTQSQVIQALRGENINISGGHIIEGIQEFTLRTIGEYKNLEEIKNTVLCVKAGAPVYLKDVAEIIDTYKEERSYSRTNKKDSVLLLINKQSGSNTKEVADRVIKKLPELKKSLPGGINFNLVLDQSRIIKKATGSAAQSGIIGGLLAGLLIFLFLRNWRPTLATITAIPLSLLATFIPLYAAGYTLNIMTLGGLALGVGMMVDSAIVVIENIYRHLEQGKKRKEAAKIGASEVGMAITASTLTTIAVFFPLTLGGGIAGQISRGLALTVSFALAASLFVALTIVPMIASKIFKKRTAEEYKKTSGSQRFKKIQNYYKRILVWALKHRKKTILAAVGLLLLTLFLIPSIGAEFMPLGDRSMSILQLKMPPGASLEETSKVVGQIEDAILKLRDVDSVSSFGGLTEGGKMDVGMGFGSAGVNEATIMIKLKDKKDRQLSSQEIQEIIRQNLPRIREAEINFMDMSQQMLGGGSPIEIKVFGKDLSRLKEIGNKIAKEISQIEGVRDVKNSLAEGKPEIAIKINREKAARLGLSAGQIGATVRNSMQGAVATKLRQAGEEIDIRVRYRPEYRQNIEDIKRITILSPLGKPILLGQVAEISKKQGPLKIDRDDQSRVALVTANTVDRDVGSIVKDIKEKLTDQPLPPGYFIEYGGSYKQMKDAFKTLSGALILAILLIYMVMASQFESLIYPFIVMFEMPLAFIGVGWALFITRQTLSLPSFMGIIMLAGIVVNNAIVLIDYVNQLRKKGMDVFSALIEGGTTRLRPILITSLTTIFGMLPMALAQQEGSEMMRPMAIAVIGGLLASTILTLVVIPVIYSVMESFSRQAAVKLSNAFNKK